ncbi:MAG: glycosyl transferase family 2, partial [Scytonema sp. PMC 1069.18]|nr:glycosyl transferase family 2 [Scytonema sp. PMC 1069.18]
PSPGHIWLGLTNSTRSLRAYESLGTIWEMVARTAFTQLNYSLGLLIVTIIGMTLVYLVPPVSTLLGLLTGSWLMAVVGLAAWLSMTYAYLPTVRFYGCSPWLAVCLSAIAFLYTLMTIDSALRHWQKRGGAWKGRVYSETLE